MPQNSKPFIFFKGKQFPVCARCTGMYAGYISFPFFTLDLIHLSLLISFILIVPTFIDGGLKLIVTGRAITY